MRKLLAVLALLAMAAPALAQESGLVPVKVDDGMRKRTYWLDPASQIEFAETPTPSAEKSATLEQVGPGVWLHRKGEGGKSLVGAGVSPAFHVSRSEDSALLALPGGVIVMFHAGVSEADARAALAARGLSIAREFELTAPSFEVVSEPGMACIELAADLLSDPLIRVATPNWWQQVQAK